MKRRITKKSFVMCCVITLFILALILVYIRFSNSYVFTNGHIYRTDVNDLSIDFYIEKINIKKIDNFTNVENLSISFASQDDQLQCISNLETLKRISIYCSDINDLTFINSLSDLNELYFFSTSFDLSDVDNSNLKKIELISCKLMDIESLFKFPKLEEIYIYNIDVVDIHSFSMMKNIKSIHLGKIGEIKNIEELPALESIERLVIHDSNFSLDYTILCDLPNLKYVGLSENIINNEEKNILQEKGINVKIYTEK